MQQGDAVYKTDGLVISRLLSVLLISIIYFLACVFISSARQVPAGSQCYQPNRNGISNQAPPPDCQVAQPAHMTASGHAEGNPAAKYLTDLHSDDEGGSVAPWTNDSEGEDDMANQELTGNDAGFADDCSTLSRPDWWSTKHIHFKLEVDFTNSVLKGFVELTVVKQTSEDANLVLDSRDITVDRVTLLDGNHEQDLPFIMGKKADFMGARLEIVMPIKKAPAMDSAIVCVYYSTSPNSTGLVWLKPEQTAGRTDPYLYSHSEAIHARSIFPCQDTPSVKATYTAEVTVPEGLTVLMSAVGGGKEPSVAGQTTYRFKQKVPIPSYLVAIAVGKLDSRKIGPRSHVWSEPSLVDRAAFEFAETEEMLATAESLAGPYVWGVYDILVLPPSFPFGGMENPCLTFLTPTLLAGDRSLANVVAHEIAHSWTGNLVTNLNWEHFWLNEGFTTFLERKIKGKMLGEEHRQFAAIEGLKGLQQEIMTRGVEHDFTKLIPNLKNADPDDAFGTVPYEKGHSLLYYLETLVGGAEKFNPCLKAWIEKYQYKTATSFDFQKFFVDYFGKTLAPDVLNSVDWEAWFHKPGFPPVDLHYDESLGKECTALRERWTSCGSDYSKFSNKDVAEFSPAQKMEFLAQLLLEPPLSVETLRALDKIYDFSATQNAEIKFRWLRLCIRGQWEDMIPQALAFAVEYQRMKFCRPIFRDLYAWDKSKDIAVATYKKYQHTMAFITANQLAKDLNLVEKA
ncbi:leukotriene A-4 hydrolase-like [Paramacrobiotus metropolitanus]|uniref:leukotriene A-4 hydrolase-like n=1 Tax=Paramacrobiotus metropolitanus TaxID=2943436 RepID=UPI0024464A69|nr:leukotriene A-4 hydrolase-like [Paramacrobiotus metropolitanus]